MTITKLQDPKLVWRLALNFFLKMVSQLASHHRQLKEEITEETKRVEVIPNLSVV